MISRLTGAKAASRTLFRRCGKTASDGGFGVAQRFSAAVITLLRFAAFSR
jgi:hypothetical protein